MSRSAVRRFPALCPRRQMLAFYPLLFSCLLAGCGGPSNYDPSTPSALPPPTTPATSNAYVGTQGPLSWTLTIDDAQHAYSYQSQPTDGSPPVFGSGDFVSQSGILDLGAGGLAIEIPGAGAILRPGDNIQPPVVLVHPENCFALSGKLRYLIDGLVPTGSGFYPIGNFYQRGDLVASTSADGKTWSFENAEYFDFNGNPTTLVYNQHFTPTTFNGGCRLTNEFATVNADTSGAYTLPTIFYFGASGMAVVSYAATGSAVGLAQPPSPISATTLASANFVGFQVEYSSITPILTQPVGFGPAVDGSVGLSGGAFPYDDVTQPADTSSLFAFGPQSTLMNGLFTGATMVVLDPQGGCASSGSVSAADLGVNSNGVATCRLHLRTMVGQINGKAVLVMSGFDFRAGRSAAWKIQFYLAQQ